MMIVGAGMAGCLAGVLNPNAKIIEQGNSFNQTHNAVLRFRSDEVAKAVGIPFKKVTVHKDIWYDGVFYQPNIKLANLYSQKVSGRIDDHSIWNLDTVERYVAPSDFHAMLEEMCRSRIEYGCEFDAMYPASTPIISTVPMNKMVDMLFPPAELIIAQPTFSRLPIYTRRFKLQDTNVHQTIYYPNENLYVYRATITGDELIIESMHSIRELDIQCVKESFAIENLGISIAENNQEYGKIQSIDDKWRKQFMYWLTTEREIYSLGRFATWRNILLDDVLKDIYKIREMINGTHYDFMRDYNGS